MLDIKVLRPEDEIAITDLEKCFLSTQLMSEEDKELFSWSAPWRKESLDHYLPLGWSFCAWEKEKLVSYILTQPLLFFNKQTQSLWVEHIFCSPSLDSNANADLVAALYGWARSKHLQKIIFSEESSVTIRSAVTTNSILKNYNFEKISNCVVISTTKT